MSLKQKIQILHRQYRVRRYYDLVNGKKCYVAGISRDTFDQRDLHTVGIFGLFGDYTPLHDNVDPASLGIKLKDQGPKNICGWVGMTSNRQNTEKVELAEQGIVQFGQRDGVISGDGFSQLRDNCKIAQKYGIPEAKFLPNDPTLPWSEYSRFSMTQEAIDNAYSHRAQSYAQVTDKNQLLKYLDEGNYIHTGMDWYNEYNMRGGFSYPWVIDRLGLTLVGGHAFEIPREAGYVKNYLNRGLHLRFQNSYSEAWGDKGYFYMPIDFAMRVLYSRWIVLDLPVDLARFLQDNAGRNVRGKNSRSVWFINNGKKFAYPNWLTFLAYDGLKNEILIVNDAQLAAVERGPDMRIETSPRWQIIKEMAAPDNYKKLLELTSVNKIGVAYTEGGFQFNQPVEYAKLGEILAEIYGEIIKAIQS